MSTSDPTSLEKLKELIRDPAKALAAASGPDQLYTLFRFLVDDRKGRTKWQALRSEEQLDRDALVVSVWQELEKKPEIAEQYHSLEYHRLWLFEWFLRRYDIRRARSVVGGKDFWTQNAHFLLLGAVVAVFILRQLQWLGADKTLWALLLCGFAYVVVLIVLALSFKEKPDEGFAPVGCGDVAQEFIPGPPEPPGPPPSQTPALAPTTLPKPEGLGSNPGPLRGLQNLDFLEAFAVATHSLIPRLAGAGAVGLVILASSQELLNVVVYTHWEWLIGLLFAGYGYLLLEMARRIHPMPRWGRLLKHGSDVAATALAHSMTLALLTEGALRKVLANDGTYHLPLDWNQSFSIVLFVFTIGLVVNLIWAEQPVTEPL